MTRFWKRLTGQNEIEARLSHERPAPPREFVDELVARIEANSAQAPSTRPRIALVGVVGAVTLVAFGATGGLGYAQSAVTGAAASTADVIAAVVTVKPRNKPTGQIVVNGSQASHQQYQEKVLVCHRGRTISVSASAVPAHLRHGDTRGACTAAQRRVLVCHNGRTIRVARSAVPAHLRHGDTRGACTAAQRRVLVCHNGRTIRVARSAVPAHLRHGDTRGACA